MRNMLWAINPVEAVGYVGQVEITLWKDTEKHRPGWDFDYANASSFHEFTDHSSFSSAYTAHFPF